ncbi:MAG TPA: PaaI family thioesterase [Thermomicrobiales bacterium]|nr:PaaI family thioesterase [Thermomicrobiales bacterium]
MTVQLGGAVLASDGAINARGDHGCFGCGRLNPHGLRLRFFPTEEGVYTPFTPEPVHEGYTGLVHGGIITTVLDEVMAWSLYRLEIWAVTAKIDVVFRRPLEVGVETRAIGRLMADRRRLLDVAAELRRASDDLLLATATATFARVPEQQAAAWQGRYVD